MIFKSLLTLTLLSLTYIQADYISTYKMDNEKQVFMYHDATHSKMLNDSEDDKSAFYHIGKKIYIVSSKHGKTEIMDMDEMKKLANAFGGAKKKELKHEKPEFSIKKTGKKVHVGGIKGEVWVVSGEDDGEPFTQEIVVSNDKRLVKTIRAQMDLFSQMADGDASGMQSMFEIQKGYVTIKADFMELVSFEEKRVAKSEYELPKDAQMKKMPDFGALFGGGAPSKDGKKSKGLLDPCYNEVCCGKTAGKSNVLAPMLKSRSGGYELIGDGVCNALGLSSLFGIQSVEGALYKKGDDPIQITLALDDSSGGSVATTKKQLDAGASLIVKSMKDHKQGVMGTASYEYAMLMPMKQQTLDIIINSKTILSITRIATNGEIDLISWTKRAIDLEAFKKGSPKKEKSSKSDKQNDDSSLDTEKLNKTVDDAVNILKSFF